MAYTVITKTNFKAYFVRDFPYGTDPLISILDADIDKAILEAASLINEDLFSSQATFDTAYENLSAHFLVMNIRASSQGLSGAFEWATSSKSVGSVSIGTSIPPSIMEQPQFAWLALTNYGAKYLMMIYPLLVGNMFNVCGGTQP